MIPPHADIDIDVQYITTANKMPTTSTSKGRYNLACPAAAPKIGKLFAVAVLVDGDEDTKVGVDVEVRLGTGPAVKSKVSRSYISTL